MKTNIETLKAVFEAAKIGSAQFVHIRNYKNQDGEISNYLINLGMSYEEQRQKDIIKLMAVSYLDAITETARRELLASKMDNSSNEYRTPQSQAQLDAYEELCNNVKFHLETSEIYLKAFLIKKEVIKAIEYRKVNSSKKTIAKRTIAKDLNLSTDKYRQFKFSNMENTTVSINGDHIEITY